jgi:hypothetical protein
MLTHPRRAEDRAARGQRHEDDKLIGQVRIGGGAAGEEVEQFIRYLIGHTLGRLASFSKGAEAGPRPLTLSPEEQAISGTGGIELRHLNRHFAPDICKAPPNLGLLPFGYPSGQSGHGRKTTDCQQFAAIRQVE